MISQAPCNENGVADMDAFGMVMNQAFIQYIEHIDADGYTANLSDMMEHYIIRNGINNGSRRSETVNRVKNRRIPMLMVPPEYHKRAGIILEKLNWE